MTHGSSNTDVMRFVKFGHYYGNGITSFRQYTDHVFVQIGSQARVELGNAAVYDNCTHREIQVPSVWSDTSITIEAIEGQLLSGSRYLFVVDANGAVSAGFAVTGAANTIIIPPAISYQWTLANATLGASRRLVVEPVNWEWRVDEPVNLSVPLVSRPPVGERPAVFERPPVVVRPRVR